MSGAGPLVREQRLAAGLSQAALGARCGMGQGRISSIECGHAQPSLDALGRIARALGKDLVVRFE